MATFAFGIPYSTDIFSFFIDSFAKEVDPKKTLLIFPNRRSIGYFLSHLSKKGKREYPKVSRIQTFLNRGTKGTIDIDTRTLILKEACSRTKKEIPKLFGEGSDELFKSLFKFLSLGRSIIKFFDELTLERLDLEEIKKISLYTGFETQIEALEKIWGNYKKILTEFSFSDPTIEKVKNIDRFEKYLKNVKKVYLLGVGALTNFEIEVLKKISERRELYLIFHAEDKLFPFQNRFLEKLSAEYRYIPHTQPDTPKFEIRAFPNRISQLGFITKSVKEAISGGIDPALICILLTDELLKEPIHLALKEANFTMGFEIKDTPIFSFLDSFLSLLPKIKSDEPIYYKDIIKLLEEPLLRNQKLLKNEVYENISKFSKRIIDEGLIFLKFSDMKVIYPEITPFFELVENLSLKIDSSPSHEIPKNVYEIILYLVENLKDGSQFFDRLSPLVKKRLKKVFSRISNLSHIFEKFKMDEEKSELLSFILKVLEKERYQIEKRPQAVQVMHLLETRNINFRCVIIPQMNEGYIPKESEKDLFLNTFIRKAVGLPTKKDREDLYRYYLRRLVYGADIVYISYSEDEKSGIQRSRFLEEFLLEKKKLREKFETLLDKKSFLERFAKPEIIDRDNEIHEIEKNEKILPILLNITYTPNHLQDYMRCPYLFYLKYISAIQSEKVLEEELYTRRISSILHKVLRDTYFYLDLKKANASVLFSSFKKRIWKELEGDKIVGARPEEKFKIKVLERKMERFFELEAKRFFEGWIPQKEFLEKDLSGFIDLNGKRIKISGRVDRVDVKGDQFCVIDYKLKRIKRKDYEIKDGNNIQLPLYLYLLKSQKELKDKKVFGLFIYDIFNSELLRVFRESSDIISDFKDRVKSLISELLSHKPFYKIKKKECEFCPYYLVCRKYG